MADSHNELYVNERYIGSEEKEKAEFQKHGQRVREAQAKLAKNQSPPHPRRVFHAKTHACLKGKLTLLESRPQDTRLGIFSSNGKASYNVLARFSNAVGSDRHDLMPDARGLALKIFGVSETAASGDLQVTRTVDFLMTNSTNAFGRDQEEFVQFMEANVSPGLFGRRLIVFLLTHRRVTCLLFKASLRIVPSMATRQYWSGHAYLLGPDRAMKFNVRPSPNGETGGKKENWLRRALKMLRDRNYLRTELLDRARRGPIKFIFSIQLEKKDAKSTPIENALIEWKERDSPSIQVAELVIDQQQEPQDCENLRFSPGNFLPAHRPLGNIGRGRIFTYKASQEGRNANPQEPKEESVFP